MNSDFSRLPHALGLTKATARSIRQDIAIAVGVVLVLLSAVFFGEWMNMSIGMLVHEASILAVILNGMRLPLFNSSKAKFDFDDEKLPVEAVEKTLTALGYEVKKRRQRQNKNTKTSPRIRPDSGACCF